MKIVPRSESFGQINEVQIARNIWCRQVWDPSIHPRFEPGDSSRWLAKHLWIWSNPPADLRSLRCCASLGDSDNLLLQLNAEVNNASQVGLTYITIQDHSGAPLELLVLKSEMLGIRVWHDVRPCRRTLNVYDVYDVLSRSLRCFASMGRGM